MSSRYIVPGPISGVGPVSSHFLSGAPGQTIVVNWPAINTGPGDGQAAVHIRDLDQDTLAKVGALTLIRAGQEVTLTTSLEMGDPGDTIANRNLSAEFWVEPDESGVPPILVNTHDFVVNIDGRLGTTLNRAVQVDVDDGFYKTNLSTFTGSSSAETPNLLLGNGGRLLHRPEHWVWLRFQDITIPQGAEIRSAFLTLTDAGLGQRTSTIINIEDLDHTEAPVTPLTNPPEEGPFWAVNAQDRTLHPLAPVVSEKWEVTAAPFGQVSSPNIAAVIQQIIDRPGWVTNNAITLHLDGRSYGSQSSSSYLAIEGDPSRRARLEINWV